MATTLKITFVDGRVEEARLNPRCMIEAERQYGGKIPPYEATLYAAWFRLGRPGGNFDAWLDEIDAAEEHEGEPTVPTQPEASEGS